MTRAISLGECMVEVSLGAGRGPAYAGDAFNTAVYLARLGLDVAFATVLGDDDPFSRGILDLMKAEGMDAALAARAPGRLPGLYVIETDAAGERRFHYWRERAPVRDFFRFVDERALEAALAQAGLVYLTGVSLAVLGDDRERLIAMLRRLDGPAIAYDPNHRPALWTAEAARTAMVEVAPLCRWLSISADDAGALSVDPATLAGGEVVFRGRDRAVTVFRDGACETFAAEPAVAARDTTGAGDAFNAAYLAARLEGREAAEAAARARTLAAAVVARPGAIIPREATPFRAAR